LTRLRLFEHECPSGLVKSLLQSPRQYEAAFRFILRYDEDILCSGKRQEHASNSDVLKFRQNPLGAVAPPVVDEVVGIPPSATRAPLGEPRPNIGRRTMNGDGVVDYPNRTRNQFISSKFPGTFPSRGVDLYST